MGRHASTDFQTGELGLVAFLTIRGFMPIDRVVDGSRCSLFYRQTPELDRALKEYVRKCPACGIAFSEVDKAQAAARRRLLDGNFGA